MEAKVLFATFEEDARGTRTKKIVNDEIIVVVDITVDRAYEPDVIGGASSTIFRKIGKKCYATDNFGVTTNIR